MKLIIEKSSWGYKLSCRILLTLHYEKKILLWAMFELILLVERIIHSKGTLPDNTQLFKWTWMEMIGFILWSLKLLLVFLCPYASLHTSIRFFEVLLLSLKQTNLFSLEIVLSSLIHWIYRNSSSIILRLYVLVITPIPGK